MVKYFRCGCWTRRIPEEAAEYSRERNGNGDSAAVLLLHSFTSETKRHAFM